MTAARFVVRGRVQGVGFRYFVRERARALGLAGWVRNTPDGSVEAAASGAAESVDALEQVLREGPPRAYVESVSRVATEATEEHRLPFSVLR